MFAEVSELTNRLTRKLLAKKKTLAFYKAVAKKTTVAFYKAKYNMCTQILMTVSV